MCIRDRNTAADVYARSELAAPQRFTVMETDDGYAVWDEIQDGIHVEPDGGSEEFTSEWEAETYRQQLIEKVQEREAKDWLYVEPVSYTHLSVRAAFSSLYSPVQAVFSASKASASPPQPT